MSDEKRPRAHEEFRQVNKAVPVRGMSHGGRGFGAAVAGVAAAMGMGGGPR